MLLRSLSARAALLGRVRKTRCISMQQVTRCFSCQIPQQQKKAIIDQETAYKTPIIDMLSLKGRVTVLTGAGRGIGIALACAAAELGSDIAVLDALESPHKDFAQLEREFGVKANYYRTDVTKPEDLKSSFDQVVEDLGHIDHCVTAAGIVLNKPFLDHGWEESSESLECKCVQIMGTFFSAQLAAKQMQLQGKGGSIVMIASVASHCAIPSQRLPIYGASKGAVRIMCQHLAVELAQYDIRINTVSPGYIATDMTTKLGIENPELLSVFSSASPSNRIGDRRDLKGIVAYLLSDASAYTTGADVLVTGGLHSGRF